MTARSKFGAGKGIRLDEVIGAAGKLDGGVRTAGRNTLRSMTGARRRERDFEAAAFSIAGEK